ncbi:MAG: hypothetical protein J6B81_03140 [Spirochaetaceae bacterium]|nr:hypothetical protein [Spirochaetaceae bacterium]
MQRQFLFVILFFTLILCVGCNHESLLNFDCGVFQFPLTAINRNAKKAVISNPESSAYAYFLFSEEDSSSIKIASETWGNVSFQVQLSVEETPEVVDGQFAFGLLYKTDFDSNGKLKKNLAERPLVRGQLPSGGNKIKVSIATLNTELDKVKGFLVHSTGKVAVAIEQSSMLPCRIGYNLASSVPEYYFGEEGGILEVKPGDSLTSIDFSKAQKLFPVAESSGNRPVIKVSLLPIVTQPVSPLEQLRLMIDIGGEEIFVRRTLGQKQITLHCSALNNPFSLVEPKTEVDHVIAIVMEYVSAPSTKDVVLSPLDTDPGMIPLWPMASWRCSDYELFQWEQFPGVLFFDCANYKIQDDFFKRLAFFTEKTGYIGTLVADSVIKNKHGFNAHDYRAETLAKFFSLATETNFPLNSKEQILCDILVANKIIIPQKNDGIVTGYSPGYGAIISISQESPLYLRYTFIAHEGLHGLYFIDSGFRQKVKEVFETSDKDSIAFLLRFFQIQDSLNYNLEDTYLVQNEFMAYVMQQSVSRTASYFADNIAWRGTMLRAEPELSAYVRNTKGKGFEQASERLSQYVFERWGIESGRVALVTR